MALVAGALTLSAPPAGADQQLSFGVKMAQRGLWSEALFRFRQAAKAEPSNPRVLNNLAVAFEAVGLFEEALETYKAAIKLDPTNRDLRRNYARFIEFYQAFKPDEPDEEPAEEEPAGEQTTAVPAAGERTAGVAEESSTEDVEEGGG